MIELFILIGIWLIFFGVTMRGWRRVPVIRECCVGTDVPIRRTINRRPSLKTKTSTETPCDAASHQAVWRGCRLYSSMFGALSMYLCASFAWSKETSRERWLFSPLTSLLSSDIALKSIKKILSLVKIWVESMFWNKNISPCECFPCGYHL